MRLIHSLREESRVMNLLYREYRMLRNKERYIPTHYTPGGFVIESGHYKEMSHHTRIISDKLVGDYFTFREKKGLISYCPRNREQKINDDGSWALEGRQALAPGKWLRSMFTEAAIKKLKIKDHEFAALTTALKLDEVANELRFEFVSFEEAYNTNNYANYPDSCMWGKPVGEFYRLFGAKALVCINGNNKYRARAVVWPDVIMSGSTEKITFMDRIYYDAPEVESAMKAYAREQGIYHKVYQSRSDKTELVAPNGDHISAYLTVVASRTIDVEYYPYLDTLSFGDDVSLSNESMGEYGYCNTDGSRAGGEDENTVTDVDGNRIDADAAQYVCGDYYASDDDRIVYSDYQGEYILSDHAEEVEGDYYLRHCREIVCAHDGEYILRDSAVMVGSEWYHIDSDEIVCDYRGEYILREDAVEIDGEYYDKDSSRIVYSDSEGEHLLKCDAVEIDDEWYPKNSDEITTNEDGDYVLKSEIQPELL